MAKAIVVASDRAGLVLKDNIKEHLISLGYEVRDVGTKSEDEPVSFLNAARNIAAAIQSGENDMGFGFCGTGMGISQALNRYRGVKAALVECKYTARNCRIINDANVMVMGGRVVTPEIAREMVDEFLNTPFLAGRDPEEPLSKILYDSKTFLEDMGQEAD